MHGEDVRVARHEPDGREIALRVVTELAVERRTDGERRDIAAKQRMAVGDGAGGKDVDESNAAQLLSTVYLAVRPPAAMP